MAGKSNYLENELLDHVFGKGAYSSPAPVWIGLWTAALDDTSDGNTAGEVSGGAYARQSIPAGKWGAAAAGQIVLGSTVSFPIATASWGTVTHIGLFDASTGGNLLYWGALSESEQVQTGDVMKFAANTLVVSED